MCNPEPIEKQFAPNNTKEWAAARKFRLLATAPFYASKYTKFCKYCQAIFWVFLLNFCNQLLITCVGFYLWRALRSTLFTPAVWVVAQMSGFSFVIFEKQPKKPIFEKGVFSRLNGKISYYRQKIKNLSVQNSCIVADNGNFWPCLRKATKKTVPNRNDSTPSLMVAGEGFEPTTFGLWARWATRLLYPAI